MSRQILFLSVILLSIQGTILESSCTKEKCNVKHSNSKEKYSQDVNEKHTKLLQEIEEAVTKFEPCKQEQCACYKDVIHDDLEPFREKGISKAMFENAKNKGTVYQIMDGRLYRQKECHFPARCSGLEHYLTQLATTLPDMEFVINTRDWPQLNKKWNAPLVPIFSFSKTPDYWDIMYPAWSFWGGGPAIKLYPTGLGKWEQHRKSLLKAAERWPWEKKRMVAFFRGSRTSGERDPIVLLSRREPHLVDASYTKNQAWKSEADTLHASPAEEVSLEDHCQYKYLFNYRGVAASFRFKHLFLCKSLVFHVGDDWQEFFYQPMKPWVHYIPVPTKATEGDLQNIIEFFTEHDDLAREIAERGFQHIWDNLRIKDVKCYWRSVLKQYSKLVKYDVVTDDSLVQINGDS